MENFTLHSTCANCTRDGVDTRLPKDLNDACIVKQELACDSCGGTDELEEWEGRDGNTYYSCKQCWFDIQETADEIKYNVCGSCELADATHKYTLEDGTVLEVCEGCFLLPEGGGCDECGSDTDFTEEYQTEDGEFRNLCENCRPKEKCDCCKKQPPTETFMHRDSRLFQLCADCFTGADHADDYGADFGSVPRIRKNGREKFCECPITCNTMTTTRCDFCYGIVVTNKKEE
jgi:hypothetical protein